MAALEARPFLLYSRLPRGDEIELVDEAEDVEREVVADHVSGEELECECEPDDEPRRPLVCHEESEHHRDRVRDRIDDAVARVPLRECLLPVRVDHHRRVLRDLPRRFDPDCESESPREREPRKKITERVEEDDAVNDVREGVPIREVLRIARAQDDAFPEFDRAAGADRRLPEEVECERLYRDDEYCDTVDAPLERHGLGECEAECENDEGRRTEREERPREELRRFLLLPVEEHLQGLEEEGVRHERRREGQEGEHHDRREPRVRRIGLRDRVHKEDDEADVGERRACIDVRVLGHTSTLS